MGKIKDNFTNNNARVIKLDESEWAYLKDLTNALSLHVLRNRLVSGYMTILARHHLPGIKAAEGHIFQYEADLKGTSRELTLTEVPIRED